MEQVTIIDEQGFPVRNCSRDKAKQGEIISPVLYAWDKIEGRLVNGQWIETYQDTRTPEEINAENTEMYNERLQQALSDLRIRAKGLAIGKTGSNAYILTQVDLYQRKYENAVTANPIPEIDADLEAEGLRDFNMNLVDFKALIVSMYTQGKERENLLMCFIEQGRSAILTLMTANEWAKVETAFSLIENLKGITTIEEARIIKNQILAL